VRVSWWHAGICALGLVTLALYSTLPPSPDQFEFDYMGWRLLAGDVPYRDLIDMNWPGPLWLHTASTFLFGNQLWSWRVFDALLFGGSCFWLADLVRSLAGPLAGRLAAAFALLLYAGQPQWFSGQPDSTAGQLLLGTFWFQRRGYARGSGWQLGSGVTLALAMLNKPTVGIIGLLLPLQALACRVPWRSVLKATAVAGVSAVMTLLLAALVLCAEGTKLAEIFEGAYLYNAATQYSERDTWADLWHSVFVVHVVWWRWLALGALAGSAWSFKERGLTLETTTFPLFWAAGVVSYFLQLKFFAYHLAACFFPIVGALAAGVGSLGARASAAGGRRRPASWLYALALLGVGAFGVSKLFGNYASALRALRFGSYENHLARFMEGDGLNVAQTVELARLMERTVPADRTALAFGAASGPNFLARRRQPTRFFYAPVIVKIDDSDVGRGLPMAAKWTAWFIADLKRSPPEMCLVGTDYDEWLRGKTPAASALRELLQSYDPAGLFGKPEWGMRLYSRRGRSN
jgi:4-amino-4-deoxy-L-arabinose transferase-like glycosyltransferase